MKGSIRKKLFLSIFSLICFFVLFSWIFNTIFLGKYYMHKKKLKLTNYYESIDKIYTGNLLDIELELERLERFGGVHITIFNNKVLKYDSKLSNLSYRDLKRKLPFLQFNDGNIDYKKLYNGEIIFKTAKNNKLKSNFLNLIAVLNNKDIIILNIPVAAIQESSDIANDFFVFTGILTLIIGSIVTIIFSKRFTEPILKLNSIAKDMCKLDFSKKYKECTDDEIGQLGNSINSLSSQLDKTISELRFANIKLENDLQRERQIDEMRKEFIANVSHELKTPIFLIQGYSEGLKLNVNENEEDKDFYCDVIMSETSKMNKLVKQLLELSQLESGYFKLEKSQLDIFKLTDRVVSKFKGILQENQITVINNVDMNLDVYGDLDRIEQVLVNYISNAIRYIDNEKQIKISSEINNEKVKISVFNTGKHISKDSLEKLWISFYKVDKARTRAYGGTGLGLSIVRSIQNLHGNAYGVENVDKGVTFWFEIDKFKSL